MKENFLNNILQTLAIINFQGFLSSPKVLPNQLFKLFKYKLDKSLKNKNKAV